MRRSLISLPALCLAFALFGSLAHADGDGDEDDTLDVIHRAVEDGSVKSLSELKTIVSNSFPGDIVRIEPHRKHGAFIYEFKVLQADGRLIEIEMDAATGRILKTENE